MIKQRQWILAGGLFLIAALASSATAKEEVDRIREKAEELAQKIQSERFSRLSEGKESNIDRVYKDFDYLLKESKNEIVTESMNAASGDMADRHRRLNEFLMHGRIFGPVAPSFDQANSYERDAVIDAGVAEVSLETFEGVLASEESRSNRRITYLASRDLRENFNVFEVNLLIDLDRQATELVGSTYQEFLAKHWDIDPAAVKAVSEEVLTATQAEYTSLLSEVVADAFEDLSVEDFREYDVPYLLAGHQVSKTFRDGKALDTADKWLKDMGLSPKSAKKLRIKLEDKEGMDEDLGVFPVANSRDTRISLYEFGGFSDYWRLFECLGRGMFYYNINKDLPFEYQRVGSPLHELVYGELFKVVMGDEAWRSKYLKVDGDPAAVARAVRFRQLYELRRNAAHYIFQHMLYEDSKTPPSKYAEWMQESLGYPHGATEETNYLISQDLHMSGLRVWATVLAAQVADKLAADHGAEWWSKGEAGTWLKQRWADGFKVRSSELAPSLQVGDTNVAAVAE